MAILRLVTVCILPTVIAALPSRLIIPQVGAASEGTHLSPVDSAFGSRKHSEAMDLLADFESKLVSNSIDHLYRVSTDQPISRMSLGEESDNNHSASNNLNASSKTDEPISVRQRRQTYEFQTFQSTLSTFEASDFVFVYEDINNTATGEGGTIQPIEVADNPTLLLANMAQTKFTIEPCGINLPHIHPRATEFIYMVSGALQVGFVGENGGGAFINEVRADMSSFFPPGLIHYQQNLECEPAVMVSSLNNVDPGTITLPVQLFALPTDALSAAFGQSEAAINLIRNALPMGPARIDCMERCGMAS